MNNIEENNKVFGDKLASLIIEAHKAEPKAYANPLLTLVKTMNTIQGFSEGGYTRSIRTGMTKLLVGFIRSKRMDGGEISSHELDEIGWSFECLMEMFENLSEYMETNQWTEVKKTIEKKGIRTYDL